MPITAKYSTAIYWTAKENVREVEGSESDVSGNSEDDVDADLTQRLIAIVSESLNG